MKSSEHQVKPETDIRSRRDKSPSREPPHPPSELQTSIRTGIGNDLHRLIPGRKLILGGVRIPFAKGPAGHSDGDALAHAICDALLGAAALGDMGRHFPNTSPQWRGVSSLLFLRHVRKLLQDAGYAIVNVDRPGDSLAALVIDVRCDGCRFAHGEHRIARYDRD